GTLFSMNARRHSCRHGKQALAHYQNHGTDDADHVIHLGQFATTLARVHFGDDGVGFHLPGASGMVGGTDARALGRGSLLEAPKPLNGGGEVVSTPSDLGQYTGLGQAVDRLVGDAEQRREFAGRDLCREAHLLFSLSQSERTNYWSFIASWSTSAGSAL